MGAFRTWLQRKVRDIKHLDEGFGYRPGTIGTIAVAGGLLTTLVMEVLSTQVWNRWAYAPAMPIIPGTGVGLAPVLQWLIVPSVALLLVGRRLEGWAQADQEGWSAARAEGSQR